MDGVRTVQHDHYILHRSGAGKRQSPTPRNDDGLATNNILQALQPFSRSLALRGMHLAEVA